MRAEAPERNGRRLFLHSLGKWSGAVISATIVGSWLANPGKAEAGVWINRRGGRGGWINRGGWNNRGGWLNRGGGGWINRFGPRRGAWVNRGGGTSWVNRW